ncbi:2673_t:CDS:2, partial [Ambispora leptoticha]
MSVQSTTVLLAFYLVTKIEDWTYTNIMNYYQEKNGEKKTKKLLDRINKDLKVITNPGSQFDKSRKDKAEEILRNWKEWKSSSNKLDMCLNIRRFHVEQLATGDSATHITNNHCRDIKVARNMAQGIEEDGRTTMTNTNTEL